MNSTITSLSSQLQNCTTTRLAVEHELSELKVKKAEDDAAAAATQANLTAQVRTTA